MKKQIVLTALLSTVAMVAPVMAEGDYMISEDPLELTIHMHAKQYPGYQEDWPVELEARKLTGIHLVDQTSGKNTEDSREAMNLLMATGDIPNIVGGGKIKEFVDQYGPEGAFIPLNDLIEEHAPNLKAFFDEKPDILAAATSADGNLYYIPYLPDGKYGRAYYIRQDWLATLGLEEPQNIDELYKVLTAFRNDDPNGNGKKDEVPFFARQWEEVLRLVTFWDGRSSGSDSYHDFYIDDGKVKHGYAGEGYRDGISNMAQWYKEGLIDAEIFTRGSSSREFLLSENLGGMTHDWFASTSGYNDSLKDKVPGFTFKAFPPPESISGVRMEEHRRIPVKPDGWAIGHTNKNPVETIKYFDFWFTPLGRNLSNFGVEDKTWTMVDGKAEFTDEVLTSKVPVNSQLYQEGAQIQRGYFQDYNYERQWSNAVALEGIELYDQGDYLIDQFLGVAMNAEEQKVFDKYWSSIRTYMLERQQAWVLGTGDVMADWDDYTATLEKMNYSDVIEVMQSAYTRQYGGS